MHCLSRGGKALQVRTTIPLQQMTVDEYAEARVAVGDRVERLGKVYWLRTKSFFYRPLLPYEPLSLSSAEIPPASVGGFQHVVADEREANSIMSFLMLHELSGYELQRLDHNRRRLIKNAAKHFVIRPVVELTEFQEKGFEAYLSFFRRTHYQYMSERRRRENYYRWAKTILGFPKSIVLGGYGEEGLTAVSVSYWVGEVLYYATFFCSTSALEKGVGELMFHALREAVCHEPGIREVFVRRFQGGNGMDKYYLLRGSRLVHKPARLCLSPFTQWMLRSFLPNRLALLKGDCVKRSFADG
jgi:hypothetical protein